MATLRKRTYVSDGDGKKSYPRRLGSPLGAEQLGLGENGLNGFRFEVGRMEEERAPTDIDCVNCRAKPDQAGLRGSQ